MSNKDLKRAVVPDEQVHGVPTPEAAIPAPAPEPVPAPAPENPEPEHVDLSTGLGGCYAMIDGKRVRVSE